MIEIHSWGMKPGGEGRVDLPTPPVQGRNRKPSKGREHTPPRRRADYGFASTAKLTRPSVLPSGVQAGDIRKREYKFKQRRPRSEP